MPNPGIARRWPNWKRIVAHAQAWVATQCVVARWPAKVLRDEQELVFFAWPEVFREHRAQHRIALNPRIEPIDKPPEWFIAAG
jgi:hypothetical protein